SPPPKNPATTIDPLVWAPTPVRVAHNLMVPAATMKVDNLDRRSDPAFLAYKWGTAITLAVVGLFIYEVLGRIDLGRSTTMLMTPIDRAIPLIPWTAWFYEPFYVGIFFIGVIGFRSRFIYDRTLLCVCFNIVVAGLGHAFIRAEYPRPHLPMPPAD